MSFFFFFGPTYRLGADQFKEHCREVIADISQRDTPVIVVAEDEPVVEMTRYVEISSPAYGAFGDVKILGNIEGPMPVEWYTHPDVRTDEDWKIDGPMPTSWFIESDEGKPKVARKPDKVDVSALHRHKVLTLDTDEFAAQLDEIVAAVSESEDGRVIIFDDEKPLVQMTRSHEMPRDEGERFRRMLKEEPFGTN